MKSGYRDLLKGLERKAYSSSLTVGVVALLLVSLLLVAVAVVCGFLQKSNPSLLLPFVITLGGGVLGVFSSLIWYLMKAREYMRAESVELDLKHPGFYDYYQQYQAKIEDITQSSNL